MDSLEVYGDCFEPYVCVQQEAIAERYRSEDGLWTPFSALPVVLIYNTKLLSPGEVADWADLLQPEFQGKIAFTDPGVSGSCFTGLVTLLQAVGGDRDETLRQFARQLEGRELDSSGDILAAVSDGSCWVGVTLEESAWKRVQAGDSIAVVYPRDGTSSVPDGSALIRGAVHPDNAKRFLDFTVSQEVQQLLSDQYRRPVRRMWGPIPPCPASPRWFWWITTWPGPVKTTTPILMSWAFYQGGEEEPLRRLLSASFRNRLFAALLGRLPDPPCCCAPPCCCRSSACGWRTGQGEADGYLDSVGQTLDQACRSFSTAAGRPGAGRGALPGPPPGQAPPRERSTAGSWRTSSPPRPWPAWICTTARGTGTCSTRSAAGRSLSPPGGVLYQARERAALTFVAPEDPGTSNSPVLVGAAPLAGPDGAALDFCWSASTSLTCTGCWTGRWGTAATCCC